MPSVSPIMVVANLSPSTESLETPEPYFTLFPKLSPELRLNVWTTSHSPLRRAKPSLPKIPYPPNRNHYEVIARSTLPALLHTCHEARAVASKEYKQAFASHLKNPVYFDFKQDILLGDTNAITAFSLKTNNVRNASSIEEEPIQRLMVSNPESYFFLVIWIDISPFKALKKIVVERDSLALSQSRRLHQLMSMKWEIALKEKPKQVRVFLPFDEMESKAVETFF
ncbi:hypothetical protein N431DRAFT_473891 [Stipitochalara longipes BDJ]|nr:hypothetical protein N431DRAFT_473891 [Stipitochalara longipes BDJ]